MRKLLLLIIAALFLSGLAHSRSQISLSTISVLPVPGDWVVAVTAWPKTPVTITAADLDRFVYCDTRKFVIKGVVLTTDDFITNGLEFRMSCFNNKLYILEK